MKIYLASSWRNQDQPTVARSLSDEGYDVYDFRNSSGGFYGFAWSEIDLDWRSWDYTDYVRALDRPAAERSFNLNFAAMELADVFVLLLPCGRSAHLEAGWACGKGKPVYIVHPSGQEPELMAKMATAIVPDVHSLVKCLRRVRDD